MSSRFSIRPGVCLMFILLSITGFSLGYTLKKIDFENSLHSNMHSLTINSLREHLNTVDGIKSGSLDDIVEFYTQSLGNQIAILEGFGDAVVLSEEDKCKLEKAKKIVNPSASD